MSDEFLKPETDRGKGVPTIDIVLTQNDKVILGRLTDKWSKGIRMWGLPGKDILVNEDPQMTVARNLSEEFGLYFNYAFTASKLIGVNITYLNDDPNSTRFINNVYIVPLNFELPESILTNPLNPQDWLEWKWFSLDDIPLSLFSTTKNAIASYRNYLNQNN